MSAVVTPPTATGTATPPPVHAGPRPWKFTREQYHEMGERGYFDGKRVELVLGEVVEMSPINIAHANAVGFVTDALARAFGAGYCINVQQPFSVPGAALGSEPQPDVVVVPGSRRDLVAHPTVAAIIVEVADATLSHDTTTKAELYATASVPDYWVLDVTNRVLHVFRDPSPLPTGLGATTYRTHRTHDATATVSPLAAPNTSITVADLLP